MIQRKRKSTGRFTPEEKQDLKEIMERRFTERRREEDQLYLDLLEAMGEEIKDMNKKIQLSRMIRDMNERIQKSREYNEIHIPDNEKD